ncbi:MAG TPA: DUF6152 family protein [Terriglobia bacterium]|jgi:hypothetical protein
MARNLVGVSVLGVALLSAAVPAVAHHAVSAEFDRNKPISFSGTVKKVEWMNPHIYTDIEAKDPASGKTVVFQVEGGAPNSLFRQGWRPDTLKIGEMVNVTGSRAKSEASFRVGSAKITKADGSTVFGGAAAANPEYK